MRLFSVVFAFVLALASPALAAAPPLDGEWDGALQTGPTSSLRLAFHFTHDADGPHATFDSVDQGVFGAHATKVERTGDHVRLEITPLNAVMEGDIDAGGDVLPTRFTQNGLVMALTLKRLPAGSPPPWPAPAKAGAAPAEPPADWKIPDDAEVRRILADRIDVQHQGVGIVVGIIGPEGRRVVAHGVSDSADPRPIDADTLFEIGSVTKVFTSLLLADMALKGEVSLDEPAANLLPKGVAMPHRGDRQITLTDLATHTSGLPRLPTNLSPKDLQNPYADYDKAALYAFLNGYQLTRDPGSKWGYSNLGAGLLGQLLANRAGVTYEALLTERVLQPLHMTSTGVTLSPMLRARLSAPHDASMTRNAYWDLDALVGAGGLKSSANDMLTFLAAELGYTDTPLKAAMAQTLAVRRPTDSPKVDQALGWQVIKGASGYAISHNGGTGGFRTLVAMNPAKRTGVVVMVNTGTAAGADDIGYHILLGTPLATLAPPPPPQKPRLVVEVDPKILEGYVGRYQLTPDVIVTVTREGEHLFAQLTTQARYEIFPESPKDFFWRGVDAQATFVTGADGQAVSMVLHQFGRDLTAPRIK